MADISDTFEIDTESSDDDRLWVKIPGAKASVLINVTDEGIILDIWPENGENGSAATCAATFEEIDAQGEYG